MDEKNTNVPLWAQQIITQLDVIRSDLNEIKFKNRLDGEFILSLMEVCRILQQTDRTVHRLRKQGRLTGFLIGRKRYFYYSEVQAYIEEERSQTNNI